MAALKYSFLLVILLACSCAHSVANNDIAINNMVEGCFSTRETKMESYGDLIVLRMEVQENSTQGRCQCKSALMSYSSSQKIDGQVNRLIGSGAFTAFGKDVVLLPIAVQEQLIFLDYPVDVSFSCAGP